MANPAEELVENWCFATKNEDLDRNLKLLSLKTSGTRFEKLNRLAKWVLGEYSAVEFENSTADAHADWVFRVNLRETFIDRASTGEWDSSWANSTHEEEEPHPLRIASATEATTRALEASRQRVREASAQTPVQEGEDKASGQPPPASSPTTNQTREDSNWSRIFESGSQYELTKCLESIQRGLAELTLRVDSLAAEKHGPPPSSTRLGGESGTNRPHVAFQDSLESNPTHEVNPSAAIPTPAPCAENDWLRGSWEGGSPQSKKTSSEDQSASAVPHNLTFSRPNATIPRDVGQIVRRWGVQFSGEPDQSAETFLGRVDECRALARLSEEEMLSSLSELFTGVAAMWYRNSKATWTTWEGFREEFRYWYGPHRGYQERLLEEAKGRTQGPGESVRDYVTCLLTILKRIEPEPSEERKVDLLHRNLQPELKKMVRRAECPNVKTFLYAAVEVELTLAEDYRPPPPAERTLVPEAAYASKDGRKARPKLAAMEVKTPNGEAPPAVAKDTLEELIKRCNLILEEAIRARASAAKASRPSSPKPAKQWSSGSGSRKNSVDRRSVPENRSRPTPPRNSSPGKDPGPSTTTPSSPKTERKLGPLKCPECGLLGYSRRYCPKCTGNEPRGPA